MKPVTAFPVFLQSRKARVALVSGLCGFSPVFNVLLVFLLAGWLLLFGGSAWFSLVKNVPFCPDWHGAHYVEKPGLGCAVTPQPLRPRHLDHHPSQLPGTF